MAAQTTTSSRSPRRATTKSARTPSAPAVATMIDPESRRALIAQAAFYRAERRGFEPGHEVQDWLAAEAEVDTGLTLGVAPSGN